MSLIVQRFQAAADTYHEHSDVQQRIAVDFAQQLADRSHGASALNRIFEIGCGTGHLTRQLITRLPSARIHATDASPTMVEIAQEACPENQVTFQTWVAEQDAWDVSQSWDGIVSSMAFQWLDKPLELVSSLAEHAATIAVAMPVQGTFDSWIAAHHELQLEPGVRPLLDIQHVNQWAEGLPDHWVTTLSVHDYRARYRHPVEFVRSLNRIGGTAPRPGHKPVNLWRVFSRFPDGIDVRYSILFLTLSRNSDDNH